MHIEYKRGVPLDARDAYYQVLTEMKKRIAGKTETIELMFIAIIADGHALLEGVPGVAKTTMTKTLANTVQADFKRIQGTTDLEPKDIIGYVYEDLDKIVKFSKGPIFTNILLIDELNRAPPKTMSSLLESLEERQVTIGVNTMQLYKPFTVFATQNPLRIEGTEPLPKVMSDRFIMRIGVDYPTQTEEEAMLRLKEREIELPINKVLTTEMILQMQNDATKVTMPNEVNGYITRIVDATRHDIHVVMGASPRADISFMKCAKAKALIEGRKEVNMDDIRFLAKPVLGHRISVKTTGGIGVYGIIDGILATLG